MGPNRLAPTKILLRSINFISALSKTDLEVELRDRYEIPPMDLIG